MKESIDIAVDLDVYKAVEGLRNSFRQSHNDILREHFQLGQMPASGSHLASQAVKSIRQNDRTRTRVRGSYAFNFQGAAFSFEALKEAYIECLKLLYRHRPDFLNVLSKTETSARSIVSRTPEGLYHKSPHLAEDHAEQLVEGWWVDVNLSQSQVESRLRIACNAASLKFGEDLKLEFP